MERVLNIHIEKLPEGVYLATSESVQGLVAQGRIYIFFKSALSSLLFII